MNLTFGVVECFPILGVPCPLRNRLYSFFLSFCNFSWVETQLYCTDYYYYVCTNLKFQMRSAVQLYTGCYQIHYPLQVGNKS